MSENNLMNRKDELIERIDSMQKFMEDYSQITMDMQKCVEKSVRFQQELIEWFGKELQSIKEQEELYLENITKEVEVAYTAKQLELKEAAQEVVATATMAAKEAEGLLNEVIKNEPVAEPVVEETVAAPVEETVEEPAVEETVEEVVEEPVVEETVEEPVATEIEEEVEESIEEEAAETIVEETPEPIVAKEPKETKKAKSEKKPGFFSRLFGKKQAKAARAAMEAEKTAETLAALTALSEQTAVEPITATTAAGLAIGGALTEEEEKHLERIQKAPKPYVGSPVKSYPRDGGAPVEPKVAEAKTVEEIITPDYEKIDMPEVAEEPVKTDEEILAENEAIVDKYEAQMSSEQEHEMTPEEEAAAILAAQGVEFEEVPEVEEEEEVDYFAQEPVAKEEVKEEPVAEEEEEEIDYFAEEEPVKAAAVKATPSNAEEEEEIDYFAEEEPAEAKEEEPVAEEAEEEVKPSLTEEGRAQIDELKSDHSKEAAATERLIDNMYRRHREELNRLCDELNIDSSMYDGYGDNADIPAGEEFERLASMIEAHKNEKKTIEDLKQKMNTRHEEEAKELCGELKLSYEDYLNNNF